MDSPIGLLKFLFPQLPGLSYAAVQHTLGMTSTSKQWDLRTELTVKVLRDMMSPPDESKGKKIPGIAKVQQGTLRDPGVKGKTWVASTVIPRPPGTDENGGVGEGGKAMGLREAVFKAVEDMKSPGDELRYTKPELVDVEVEWTGYRPEAATNEVLPDIKDVENYKRLMQEPTRTSEVTILYFHGGAYYLCDPSTHRPLTSRLAKESHGRVCSVRYRLAPQTAFPGQLLDALMVYLSLIYPPPDSLHEAVPAEKIVFGGDSAGGNLSFALLQLLLQLHRSSQGVPILRFHNRDVHVPLPAGVSANSGWFDIARAMPSIVSNSKWDYLPPADHDDAISQFPHDSAWPTTPPRGDLFCDLSLLDHPLVSPVLAKDWTNAPPLWLCTGQEMLSDEDCVVAAKAARQGVTVQWEQYEAMPHVFAMLIPHLGTSKRCMSNWGDWARRCVVEREALKTRGVVVGAKDGKEKEVEVSELPVVSEEEVWGLVRAAKLKRLQGFEKEGKGMLKPAL